MSTTATNTRLLNVKSIADTCLTLLHTTSYQCSKVILREKVKSMKLFVNGVRWLIRVAIHEVTRFISTITDLISSNLPQDALPNAIKILKGHCQMIRGDVDLVRTNVERLAVYYEEPGLDEEVKKAGVASAEAVEVVVEELQGEVANLTMLMASFITREEE